MIVVKIVVCTEQLIWVDVEVVSHRKLVATIRFHRPGSETRIRRLYRLDELVIEIERRGIKT